MLPVALSSGIPAGFKRNKENVHNLIVLAQGSAPQILVKGFPIGWLICSIIVSMMIQSDVQCYKKTHAFFEVSLIESTSAL